MLVALAFSGVWIVPLHIFLMNIFDPSRVQENPYVMRKDNYQDFQGNDQYEGFCVDMLREVADILKFSFKIKLVDDGLYGAPEPNGSWTGMVGELINRVSTIAQPLSVSQQTLREKKNGLHREKYTHKNTHTRAAPNLESVITSHVSNWLQKGVKLLSRTKADFVIPQKSVVALPKVLRLFFAVTLLLPYLLPPLLPCAPCPDTALL